MNRSAKKHMKSKHRFKTKTYGKHFKEKEKITISKKMLIQISLLLLICIVTSSIAYIVNKYSISNEFVLGEVKINVIETFDKKEKSKKDVYLKNTGNVPVYVRTAIIITWKDEKGNILEERPVENVDYSIKFSDSSNWIKSKSEYYYYKNYVNQDANTDILIEECRQIREYEGKILEVSIACQAIQAEPSKAVIEAWNVDIIDGVLFLN